ncbi:hypothetical protein [Rhodanobacter sp. B04]|uniref:hypothetical protein n=1 Tax=Rhodanobacter sp. B04 TaxID=1945860 RepID=UPI00143CA89C|nr:hypothetical protein [Rhodanobacter sp. B04]
MQRITPKLCDTPCAHHVPDVTVTMAMTSDIDMDEFEARIRQFVHMDSSGTWIGGQEAAMIRPCRQ